jgi:uncharacterized coiled-coil DUF342 family protein
MFQSRLARLEPAVMIAAAVLALAFGVRRIPRPVTRDYPLAQQIHILQRLQELETATRQMRAETGTLTSNLAELAPRLTEIESAFATFQGEQETTESEVTQVAARADELETLLQATAERLSELDKLLSFNRLALERDQAVEDAKAAKERIRELTLELQRSGQWP